MGLPQAFKKQDGVALFMVIGAMTILAILVSEFTYLAQVNQKLAYDSFDQVKALYAAKSGLKISLMRLKAYQNLRSIGGSGGAGGSQAGGVKLPEIPKKMLQQIWAFPIIFPLPPIPGMAPSDQQKLAEFNQVSGLGDVQFTATIESESGKFSINQLTGVRPSPTPTTSSTPTPTPSSTQDILDPRQATGELINDIINERKRTDEGFAAEYRDLRVDELLTHLQAWVDPTVEDPAYGREPYGPAKRAPFYALSELHMVPGIDDTLAELLEPHFTVSMPQGVNVNTITPNLLRSLIPAMRDEEEKEFFEFRDKPDEDNLFKDEAAFLDLVKKVVQAFRTASTFDAWRENLKRRGIQFTTDDTDFKITVRAQSHGAIKTIEARVSLTPDNRKPRRNAKDDPGLTIVSMRIL